jgi:hypothetical protein
MFSGYVKYIISRMYFMFYISFYSLTQYDLYLYKIINLLTKILFFSLSFLVINIWPFGPTLLRHRPLSRHLSPTSLRSCRSDSRRSGHLSSAYSWRTSPPTDAWRLFYYIIASPSTQLAYLPSPLSNPLSLMQLNSRNRLPTNCSPTFAITLKAYWY